MSFKEFIHFTCKSFNICQTHSDVPLLILDAVICLFFFSDQSFQRFINIINIFKTPAYSFIDFSYCFCFQVYEFLLTSLFLFCVPYICFFSSFSVFVRWQPSSFPFLSAVSVPLVMPQSSGNCAFISIQFQICL